MRTFHPSLIALPGVSLDQFGNLKVQDVDTGKEGLRHRYEHLMNIPGAHLRGTILSELLNWLRWGGEDGVMWECTLVELVSLIERWEENNSSHLSNYGVPEDFPAIDWYELWFKSARAARRDPAYMCSCGNTEVIEIFCPDCGKDTIDMKRISIYPREFGSYNLGLHGADGLVVAAAAFYSRLGGRIIPEHLK